MLLAVYNYNSPRALVSRSALGILLIILCLILAHIGIQKQFSPHPLVLTLCMTVSALWSNTGTLQLLVDNKIVSASDQFCEAIFPGLFAISCAFLIIGCVGTLHKQGPLPVMSFALGLANIHVLAMCNDRTLGPSGIGCNFMIVTTVSLYLVALRFWNILQKNPGQPVETRVHSKNYLLRNHLIVTGVMANMVSSSVLCGRLIGTARILFFGQAHWMFTSALYQLIVSVASFCASDMLNAAFFSFLSILKFVEGYSVFNQPHLSNDPLLPLPFMVVFAVLFGILACMMSLKNLYFGIYTLLFAAYCASLTLPSGIEHIAPQVINLIIFMASIVYMFLRLYLSKAEFKTSQRHGLMEIMNSCLPKIKQRTFLFCSYSDGFRFKEVDAIGHAFNTLAVFAIITETRVAFILVIVVGVMVLIAGLLSASAGKTLEGSTFIFYGIWWITFGMVKYLCLCVSVMVFYSALGNICFIILHGFVTACMITLNKVWFINSLAFEALLITILLKTLAILTWKCTIAFSVIFGVVSFYCFLASILNGTVETPHLPWGEPFLKDPQLKQGHLLCILPAKKISSIKKIVEILNVGGICVIPADEGYVIASVCQFPDSVQKVSKIDIENTDNEMSIFITSIEQLQPIKHLLSKLMLDFIEGLWPNPVGFVLPKIGDWLTGFQLATTSSLSGSSKNVIIYVSDCEVTTQIINQVGPIAVRSLPKGAHTHPSQMFPKLRSKVNGILLDEEHNNDDIFTVVDCTQIKRGIVDFVKVGIIPTTQVMNVLHTVMSRRENGFNTLCSVHL